MLFYWYGYMYIFFMFDRELSYSILYYDWRKGGNLQAELTKECYNFQWFQLNLRAVWFALGICCVPIILWRRNWAKHQFGTELHKCWRRIWSMFKIKEFWRALFQEHWHWNSMPRFVLFAHPCEFCIILKLIILYPLTGNQGTLKKRELPVF